MKRSSLFGQRALFKGADELACLVLRLFQFTVCKGQFWGYKTKPLLDVKLSRFSVTDAVCKGSQG